ncbi:DUF7948 domain-containing protein [Thermoflexus hugenholtzii]
MCTDTRAGFRCIGSFPRGRCDQEWRRASRPAKRSAAPGADLSRMRVRLAGAKALSLVEDGRRAIETGLGEVFLSVPKAWQEGGERRGVRVRYRLLGATPKHRRRRAARQRRADLRGGHRLYLPLVVRGP